MSNLEWTGLTAAVFLATALLDFTWVHCVAAVKDERALATGGWSAATCAIGLVALAGVLKYSAWMAVPDVLGAFVGGAGAVAYRRRARARQVARRHLRSV